jgi:hypothetical protein
MEDDPRPRTTPEIRTGSSDVGLSNVGSLTHGTGPTCKCRSLRHRILFSKIGHPSKTGFQARNSRASEIRRPRRLPAPPPPSAAIATPKPQSSCTDPPFIDNPLYRAFFIHSHIDFDFSQEIHRGAAPARRRPWRCGGSRSGSGGSHASSRDAGRWRAGRRPSAPPCAAGCCLPLVALELVVLTALPPTRRGPPAPPRRQCSVPAAAALECGFSFRFDQHYP